MKIILTGSSGFIGQEVLRQALSNSTITSVVALSRKPLPAAVTKDPKLDVVLMDDFSRYTPAVLSKLEGAEACIWTIGAKSTDPVITRKVSVDYTLAAINAFSQTPKQDGNPFRFVFTSGILAVRDQKKRVFLYPEARKVAGEAEIQLVDFAQSHSNFQSYIMRPSGVLTKENTIKNYLMGFVPSVRVDELAATMVDVAINGAKMQTWENGQLAKRGRELLSNRRAAR
ncbi:hypothetical protein BDZ45DRAFT_606075 [Acephala macrosclerotiorum]|nr:hypothetical protein BDZ45DRAFT_606075 [Acephala macrosclerotiorum]